MIPFALSLSKGLLSFFQQGEGGCFDKLSTNGGGVVLLPREIRAFAGMTAFFAQFRRFDRRDVPPASGWTG